MNLKKIGEKIQERRKEKGLSLGELSQAALIAPKSLVLLEHGQAKLDLECLLCLCNVLDITPNQILSGEFKVSEQTKMKDAMSLMGLSVEQEAPDQKGATVTRDVQSVQREIQAMIARSQQQSNSARRY